jgi:SSS family solute:Na+ symporter
MASVILGSLVVVLIEKKVISILGLDPIIPGLAVSIVVFVLFSYLMPPKNETLELSDETA